MSELVTLKSGDSKAEILDGKLVGFENNGIQYIHGGGKPDNLKTPEDENGWQDSEIIMFPVVGIAAGHKVKIGDSYFKHSLHGISQFLEFKETRKEGAYVEFIQHYDGKTPLKNPEYKKNRNCPECLEWPFEFEIKKSIKLREGELRVGIYLTNKSKKDMPYMLGFHPAFKVLGNPNFGAFVESKKKYALEEIVKDSDTVGAFFMKGINHIFYKNDDKTIEVLSKNFDDMMIWSPGMNSGMFCIEPLTNLPARDPGKRKHFYDENHYRTIESGATREYKIIIRVGED